MSFRTAISRNKADLARAAIGVVTAGVLMLPYAINQHAEYVQETSPAQLSQAPAPHRERLANYPTIDHPEVDDRAADTISAARSVIEKTRSKTDVTELENAVSYLSNYRVLKTGLVERMIDETTAAADKAVAAAAEADRVAAEKAAQAAAQAAAANTPDGARATARTIAASEYGWGEIQFQCLDNLWTRESNWNYQASNGSSGAAGIPQALPGSKMASAGADWATNATTQIRWGLAYISRGYGTPCSAWSHSQSVNWY